MLQHRVRALEQENSGLSQALSLRDAEIKRLKERPAGPAKGARSRNASSRKAYAAR